MASLLSSEKPDLPAPGDEDDPFVSRGKGPSRQRYSNFDEELFAAGPGSSPRQARRALEAHLAETERRLDEAGKLGTALVAQRKVLAEQLQEIESLPAEDDLSPDLRQRLVDVEKEYNDLSRESARALLPKQRVPSNEAAGGSPYVPEGRSGRVRIFLLFSFIKFTAISQLWLCWENQRHHDFGLVFIMLFPLYANAPLAICEPFKI